MATKTIRINTASLSAAEKVLSRIGMQSRTAIEMFLAQVALKKAIPFPITAAESDDGHLPHEPNAETLAALAAPETQSYRSTKALLAGLKK
jgi:addiction module RelB/DinJ family antitoxin